MRFILQLALTLVLTFYLMVVPSLDIETKVLLVKTREQAVTAFKPSGSIFEKIADGGLKRALTLGLVQKINQELDLGDYYLLFDEAINDGTRIAVSFYLYSKNEPVDLAKIRIEAEMELSGAQKLTSFYRLQGEEGAVLGYIFCNYLGRPQSIAVKGAVRSESGQIQNFARAIDCQASGTVREVYFERNLGGNPEIILQKVILAPTQWIVMVNLKGSREDLEAYRNLNMPLKLYSDGNPLELLGLGSSIGGIPPRFDGYFYFQPGGQEKGALLGVNWPDGKSREVYLDFTRLREKPRVEITPIYENLPNTAVPKPPVPAKPTPVPATKVLKGIDWIRAACKDLMVWIPEKNFAKIREIADEMVVLDIKDAFGDFNDYKLELVNFNYQEDQKGYLVNLYVEIRGVRDNSYLGSADLELQFVPQGDVFKLNKFSKN